MAALLGVAAITGASLPGSAQAVATLKIATTPTDIGSEVMKRATYASKLDPALVQPPIDASAKYGITKTTIPVSRVRT